MTDLYERRIEAANVAIRALRGVPTAAELTDFTEYLLHGKQTSGEETQTLGSVTVLNQTFGGEIDLDALSIRILENLDLIGDASWHEEEDEELEPAGWEALLRPQPGDADFGEIRVYVLEEFDALPTGSRVEYTSNVSDTIRYWEKREDGTWFPSDGDHETWYSYEFESKDGRQLLNPEILGTFRPVEHTPQPGDEDFGEIWVMDLEAVKTLPDGVELTLDGGGPGRVTVLGGQGRWAGGHRQAFHEVDFLLGGRRVLNPEILGTFRPVEG